MRCFARTRQFDKSADKKRQLFTARNRYKEANKQRKKECKRRVEMFNEIKMVQAEFLIRNAKYNNMKEAEGFTVQVPNVIDRAVMAVRKALTNQLAKPRQTNTVPVRSGAVAR
jgi:hypothetical protein